MVKTSLLSTLSFAGALWSAEGTEARGTRPEAMTDMLDRQKSSGAQIDSKYCRC
jgi:hypothetical protein